MPDRPFDFSEFRSAPGGGADQVTGVTAEGARSSNREPDPADPAVWWSGPSDTAAPDPSGLTVAGPPVPLLMLTGAFGMLGIAGAALAAGRPWVAITAWLIAGPCSFAMLGLYSYADTRRRARPLYASPAWVGLAYWVVVVVLLVALVASALRIAEWAGRL